MNNLTHFTSLTSRTLDRMMESDLFVAPRCWSRFSHLSISSEMQPTKLSNDQPNDQLIDAYLDNSIHRSFLVYHLHNIVSSIARVVATIAINILVPPIGLFYHTSQALHQRNISELRNRHLTCARLELIRLAAVTYVASRVAFPNLYLVSLSGGAEIARVFFAILPLLSSICLIFVDILATFTRPGYNSRSLDDNNGNWLAKMALKWELGVHKPETTKLFLKTIISRASDRFQGTVDNFHALLEEESNYCLIGSNVTSNFLLNFLATHLSQYKTSSKWNKIIKHRDEILHYKQLIYLLNYHITYNPREPIILSNHHKKTYSNNDHQGKAYSDYKLVDELSKAKTIIEKIGAEENTSNEPYRIFKSRVFTSEATYKTILGYEQDAKIKRGELKKIYKKLAFVLHPDKNPKASIKLNQETEELFKLLMVAFDHLNNPINEQLVD